MILFNQRTKTFKKREMTLIIILACVFLAVFLMVILGERFGSPISEEQQSKYSKIIPILVFILLGASVIKMMF